MTVLTTPGCSGSARSTFFIATASIHVIDGMLVGDLADRDKTSAVHAKVRAARIRARLDDSAVTACDYGAMKQAILTVLSKNKEALRAVVAAFS
ncbi:MAG: hypothetical protein KIT84_05115 [Labilithrix sp.]|nr:hypothetical protein [Labilithrix sp.]MCW5810367.1 hypothetical protein [Labilithrix sp.]